METTKNKLRDNENAFFYRLKNSLETPIYYYGSIQRSDYIPGKSDIDVDIFTVDEKSMMIKLANFLKIDISKFQTVIWRLKNNTLITGYKTMYHDPSGTFNVEFSIYNEKYKKEILEEHNKKFQLNFLAKLALYILKTIYYQLNIIDRSSYAYLKKKILSYGTNSPDDDFLIIKN